MSGREEGAPVRRQFTEPINRVLGWMLSLRDGEGAIICPFHRIEHTGKSAGVIAMACALARHDPQADRAFLFGVAREQALRLVRRLEREGNSTCFTFRPGRHDPYNCSNSVIDGGACTDALVDCVETFGADLSPEDAEALTQAAVLSAQTYLRYCVIDKWIPAQKAWALTGVAQALRLSGHEVLDLTVREGTRILGELQREDGSYPYHPAELGAPHPGASDASAYYQSRVTAFLGYSLERAGLGVDGGPWEKDLARGVDFLLGLVGPDGIKAGLVEAKPWYWGADHEVVSNPFDMYALGLGLTALGDGRCAAPLIKSFSAWEQHLLPSGEPRSHLPGPGRKPSYQCPIFWGAHATWAARALPFLEAAAEAAPGSDGPQGVRLFQDTGLVRLDHGGGAAWVRGLRPAGNLHHGSPLGAGLIRVVGADGTVLLERNHSAGAPEGEWADRSGGFQGARGWRANRKELRFSVWLARNALRGGRWARAVSIPLSVLTRGVLAYGSGAISSAYDREAVLEQVPGGVRVRGALAHRDGSRVSGTAFERVFTVQDGGLLVRDTCTGAQNPQLTVPKHATGVVQEEGSVSYFLPLGQDGHRSLSTQPSLTP